MSGSFVIAIVGAESTGKTRLARELAEALAQHTGLASTWVPEVLREWCDARGRTPRADEQAGIAAEQHARIEVAVRSHAVVVSDTTALMTAIYSRMLFADESLRVSAVQRHRRCDVTLLTALDLPWQADGWQRDGAHVRAPVDALLRQWLVEDGFEWSVVGGQEGQRLQNALDAVAPRLRARSAPARGLFTRLGERNASALARRWVCETCDVPECEHALLRGRASGRD